MRLTLIGRGEGIGAAADSEYPSCGILGATDQARGEGELIFMAGAVCLSWPTHRLIAWDGFSPHWLRIAAYHHRGWACVRVSVRMLRFNSDCRLCITVGRGYVGAWSTQWCSAREIRVIAYPETDTVVTVRGAELRRNTLLQHRALTQIPDECFFIISFSLFRTKGSSSPQIYASFSLVVHFPPFATISVFWGRLKRSGSKRCSLESNWWKGSIWF